ncbi:MAG: U32 family peptidase [bacterium]|nr:U32 family peptidase [bacterium]
MKSKNKWHSAWGIEHGEKSTKLREDREDMKILAPVDSINELDGLISAGVDEFYGGFIPYNWFREYGAEGSPNRRNFMSAQIKSENEFSQIIEKIHSHNKLFYLTLNQKLFNADQYPLMDNLMKYIKSVHVDGLIVADLGLSLFLKKGNYNIPVILSTLAQVMNARSAKFYGEMGFKRIVLSRDLSLKETENIVKSNPSIAFETLMLIGKCFNLEGFCTYEHCNPNRVWPCNQEYKISFDKKSNLENEVARQIKVYSQTNRTDACGLCSLIQLKKIGIKSLKIVGRGATLERKIQSVESIKSLLNLIKSKTPVDNELFYVQAREKYEYIFKHGCAKVNCYFPELTI